MSVTVLARSTFRGYQHAFVLGRASRARSSNGRRQSTTGRAPSFDPRASTLRAPQKPILLPKLRIRLADFPCLHCSLSARGFSPRRPDAVNRYALDALGLSRTGSDFQGTTRRSPDATRTGRAFRPRRQLLLRTTCFRSRLLFRPYKEKRTLPGARVVVSERGNASPLRPGANAGSNLTSRGSGIGTRFPFGSALVRNSAFCGSRRSPSGAAIPRSIAGLAEPCSSSAFEGLA